MRGNDPTAAAELASRYGEGAGNAEALIEANAARFTQELVAAQLLPRNQELGDKLDADQVAKAADLPDGHRLRAASVRHGEGDEDGGYVIFVAQDPAGRLWKGALPRSSGKVQAAGGPARTSADVHAAQLKAEIGVRQEAAAALAEVQRQVEATRQKAEAEAAEHIRKAEADAQRIRERAVEEARKAEEKDAKASRTSARPASSAKSSKGETESAEGDND